MSAGNLIVYWVLNIFVIGTLWFLNKLSGSRQSEIKRNENLCNQFLSLSALKAWIFLVIGKKLNKKLRFGPISTILGRKVDIVGRYLLNLYVAMEIVT